MISVGKIQELLAAHLETNGWRWKSTWKSDRPTDVLIETWLVESVWSPVDVTFYVGFENWDVYESVGISTVKPEPDETREWIESVGLLKNWESEFSQLLHCIEELRNKP